MAEDYDIPDCPTCGECIPFCRCRVSQPVLCPDCGGVICDGGKICEACERDQAKLIAAAPQLLGLCKSVVDHYETVRSPSSTWVPMYLEAKSILEKLK